MRIKLCKLHRIIVVSPKCPVLDLPQILVRLLVFHLEVAEVAVGRLTFLLLRHNFQGISKLRSRDPLYKSPVISNQRHSGGG